MKLSMSYKIFLPLGLVVAGYLLLGGSVKSEVVRHLPKESITIAKSELEEITVSKEIQPLLHQNMPTELRGIYISGWTAGNTKSMDRVFSTIEKGNLNAVVIDIKDASGRLTYQPLDPWLVEMGVGTNKISNLADLIKRLHDKNIFVIGRLTVFQDPYFARKYPDQAFKDKRTGVIWNDYKGISWLKPDSLFVWDYTVSIAKDAYAQGFDEINLDYVRFPSDGPLSSLDIAENTTLYRSETMQSFFEYMDQRIRNEGIILSADLFGLTMSATGDIGIGQNLEMIAPYVDYIAPMVYPSHFGIGTYGIESPSHYPYEIIYRSISDGISKLEKIGIPKEKIRPWIQDFNLLGVTYDYEKVHAQIKALNDIGLYSWLVWDPKNTYTGLVPR